LSVEFQQFGTYRIEALLGRGGMGDVYRAFDTQHERTVALKVLSEDLAADVGYRERFRREAHLAAALNEPHIVPIHRYGEIDGRLFLDMRLVRGRDVAAVLSDDGPMAPERAVSVISQVARALDAAHAEGLVHRDVKPSNILLTGEGDDEFAYLVDFGIARSTTDAQGPALTQTGQAVGSFEYMAPERFLEREIDRRVDVYALGCVLFECLTGRRPFTNKGIAGLMYAHLHIEPPAPSSVRPELPGPLDAVVLKAMAKDPDERYATAGELAAAARTALRRSGMKPTPEVGAPAAAGRSSTPLSFTAQTVTGPDPGGAGPRSDPGEPNYGPLSGPGGPSYGPPSDPGGPAYGPPSAGGPAYGPPSGPGGPPYGPPSAGGPYGGGPPYGPPSGPGGPYGGGPPYGPPGGGPGGPGPAGGGRNPNRLPLIIAAAVVVVAAVVVLVVVLVRDRGGGGGTASNTTAVTDTSTATTTTSETTTTQPVDPEQELLSIVPGGFDKANCRTQEAAGDGDLAALDCGASSVQPGPTDSAFYLYADTETADGVFLDDAERYGLVELTAGTHCPDAQGFEDYTSNGETAGRIACYVRPDDNASILIWTQDEYAAEGFVYIVDGGEEGLKTLVDWWREPANSDFVE
jgi:serine/threonine-protein kinase